MADYNKIYSPLILALIAILTAFSFIPETLWNWAYDYFQFLPAWGVVGCIVLAIGVLFIPQIRMTRTQSIVLSLLLLVLLPIGFIVFRTRIHCFSGDGCVGMIPADLSLSWRNFIPPLPTVGRLDTYGLSVVMKLSIRGGLLGVLPGMATIAASQVYAFLWGAIYVLLAITLFARRKDMLFMVLTFPWVLSFFGNIDCYPLPLCVALVFLFVSCKVLAREQISFWAMMGLSLFWLVCGWVHPLAGVAGFVPAVAAARWWNGRQLKFKIPEAALAGAYGVVFFVVIVIGYKKAFFSAPFNDVPPIFSVPTFIHMLNVCILPVLPLAVAVLLGRASHQTKVNCLVICASQLVCFTASHFTQGVNDQFPYALYMVGMMIPWLVAAWKSPLDFTAVKGVVALNLLVLVPMVWVHSSDATVARALALYPLDTCKHNSEMSWQTHLGLVLGDNLIDSDVVKTATLKTFSHGSRQAFPAAFRGGNTIYHTAFLYHFGEFERGAFELRRLIASDPRVVRYFLSPRPAFAYLNRQRLWDDLLAFSPENLRGQLRPIIDNLREKAKKERYCLNPPRFQKCEY